MKNKLILFASILSFTFGATPNAFAQWVETTIPNPYILCLAASGTNLFAGTPTGVYLSADLGQTWTPENSGFSSNDSVTALIVSGTNLFASARGVYISTDNGTNWTRADHGMGGDSAYVDCFAVSGTNLYAGIGKGGDGGVYHSIDNGSHWTASATGLGGDGRYVDALAVCGPNLIAGTGYYKIGVNGSFDSTCLSTDNGTSWTVLNGGPIGAESFAVSGSNIFAGTWGTIMNPKNIYHSTDYGMTWDSCIGDTSVMSLAVMGSNIFAGTYTSGVILSKNNGATWDTINGGFPGFGQVGQTWWTMSSLAIVGPKVFVGSIYGASIWRRDLSDFGIRPSISLSTSTLNFGTLSYGSDSSLTVEFYNTSGSAVGIDSAGIAGAGAGNFAITANSKDASLPYQLQSGDSIGFSMTYTAPSKTETDQATLRIAYGESAGNVLVDTLTGASEAAAAVSNSNSNQILAFVSPNPASTEAVISFSTSSEGNVKVELFDVLGNNITASGYEATLAAGSHAASILLDGLPTGIYYARILTAAGTQMVKLVKR